jgi:hypothetical protein
LARTPFKLHSPEMENCIEHDPTRNWLAMCGTDRVRYCEAYVVSRQICSRPEDPSLSTLSDLPTTLRRIRLLAYSHSENPR